MIVSVEGVLTHISDQGIVIKANGLGYFIKCHGRLREYLNNANIMNDVIDIVTHLAVREDAQELYGFTDEQEKKVFLLLCEVKGIGPKASLNIIGKLEAHEIVKAVVSNDYHALKQCPGIGLKTAQRIILELREKLAKLQGVIVNKSVDIGIDPAVIMETEMTLLALGYSSGEIGHGLQGFEGENPSTEDLFAYALTRITSM